MSLTLFILGAVVGAWLLAGITFTPAVALDHSEDSPATASNIITRTEEPQRHTNNIPRTEEPQSTSNNILEEEGSLALDTYKRMKEKSNVRFE